MRFARTFIWCGYTESPGAPYLRETIAATYERCEPDDVLVATSAEEAIFTLYHALFGPGDHAISGSTARVSSSFGRARIGPRWNRTRN